MRRELVYLGWTGFSNFGDELLYETWRAALAVEPIAQAPLGRAYLRRVPHVVAARLRGIGRERLLLLGGGTTVGFGNWARHVERARLAFGTRGTIIAGAGIADAGDAHALSTQSQDWTPWRRMSDVVLFGLRGPISSENAAGAWRETTITGDPALLYPEVVPVTPSRLDVGIAVSVGASGTSRFDLPTLAAAVDELAVERGVQVTVVQLADEDADVCARLRALLEVPTSIHRFAGDVHETMEVLAAAELVVSERLHGAVAGFALRRPTVSLSYGSKCEDFWQSVVDHGDAVPVGARADDVLRAARAALESGEQMRRDARVEEHCRSLRAVVGHVDAWVAGTTSTDDLRKAAEQA